MQKAENIKVDRRERVTREVPFIIFGVFSILVFGMIVFLLP